MDITTRDANGIKVVGLEGQLATDADQVEAHLSELVDQGATKIVIDFERVDYVSSSGLRVLLATAKKLLRCEGSLGVCSLNESVQDVFDMSGFSALLAVFGSEAEALEGN